MGLKSQSASHSSITWRSYTWPSEQLTGWSMISPAVTEAGGGTREAAEGVVGGPGRPFECGVGRREGRRAGREGARADPALGDCYSPLSGHSNSDVSSASLKPPLEPPPAEGASPPPLSIGFDADSGGGAARREAGNGGGFATFFLIALASGLSSDDIATRDGGRLQQHSQRARAAASGTTVLVVCRPTFCRCRHFSRFFVDHNTIIPPVGL